MFRRLTRARTALIGMATVTIAAAITGIIAQPGERRGPAVVRVRAVAHGRGRTSVTRTSGSLNAHSKGG
jgi:hypothetical protein